MKELKQFSDKELLKAQIYNYIAGRGCKRVPVTTEELCNHTGLTGRQLRNLIQEIREDYPIVSREDEGGGYWLGNSDDIQNFIDRILSRKRRYEKTIRVMKRHIK